MTTQTQDIQTLKTDVALIKQEQRNQTETLKGINTKLDNLSFVSQKDYEADMFAEGGVIDRLKKLETMVNAGGVKASNAVVSGVGKGIIAALVVGLLFLIGWSILRVAPAAGGVS